MQPFSTQQQALAALARQASAQLELRRSHREMGALLARVKILSGLVPMCAWCRRVRNEKDLERQLGDPRR